MDELLRAVSPFQDTLAEIAQWAAGQNLILTRTHFSGQERMPIARWPDGTWQDFLRAARQSDARIVWVEIRRYAAFEKESNGDEGVLSVVERPQSTGDPRGVNSSNGKKGRPLAALCLSWSYEGVLNVFLAGVRWGEVSKTDDPSEEELERNLQEVIEQAKLLVDMPEYVSKESREERRRLAQRLFGSGAAVGPIVKQAEALCEAAERKMERSH